MIQCECVTILTIPIYFDHHRSDIKPLKKREGHIKPLKREGQPLKKKKGKVKVSSKYGDTHPSIDAT